MNPLKACRYTVQASKTVFSLLFPSRRLRDTWSRPSALIGEHGCTEFVRNCTSAVQDSPRLGIGALDSWCPYRPLRTVSSRQSGASPLLVPRWTRGSAAEASIEVRLRSTASGSRQGYRLGAQLPGKIRGSCAEKARRKCRPGYHPPPVYIPLGLLDVLGAACRYSRLWFPAFRKLGNG